MKQILRIYRSDIQRILNNWVAALIVIVLCILPSLYAWFYLKSSRDPYGNTKGIKVAVVNLDQGTFFKKQFINIGTEVIDELKSNTLIGWVFVDEKIAQEGTRLGQYYANIIIESWFSEKMVTLLDEFPQHPGIRYTVNEKLNAIAPKITSKGASTIKENIQKAFIDTIHHVLMERLNSIGFDLQKSKTSVYALIDFIHDAKKSIDHLDEKINKILELSYRSRFRLEEVYRELPEVENHLSQGKSTLINSAKLANNSLEMLDSTPEKLKKHKQEIQSLADDIDTEFGKILSHADQKSQAFANEVRYLSPKLTQLENKLAAQTLYLTKVKELISSFLPNAGVLGKIDTLLAKLQQVQHKSNAVRSTLNNVSTDIEHAVDFWKDTQKTVNNIRQDFKDTLDDIRNEYQDNLEPYLNESFSQIRDLSVQGVERIQQTEKKIPDLKTSLEEGVNIISTEADKIIEFQKKLPKLQGSITNIDTYLQKLKKTGKIDDFIQIATLNPERFSDFISDPIILKENRLFSIPNYGSAMSPFFTILAIRVGSLLSISLFSTKVIWKKFTNCKRYQKYFGKWLFFLTIALIQASIVALGDMRLLNAYVANPLAFYWASLGAAVVFSLIIYTTVTTFGNAGKAIVIVFLVLQLSGAWGTFPIQLSGTFFQTINPFLPFTYTITAMREAVGGVVREIYLPNMIILLGFLGCFILIGLFLKPLIACYVEQFEEKFSASQLGEH